MKKATFGILTATLITFGMPVIAAENEAAAPANEPAATEQAAPAETSSAQDNQAIEMQTQWRTQFQKLDKNHDGVIDKKEAKQDKALNKAFKKVAKKGKLNETDYLNWQASKQHRG